MTPYNIQNTDFSLDDIKQVVNIHRQEIRQGFLSSLGNKALELLFSLAVESNYGVLLIAKNANNRKVCGFLLGTVDTGKFYKDFLIKKSFQAIVVLIPKMLSLDTIRKLMETLFYPSESEIQDMPNAELLDIAIVKEHQGTGLARSLFEEFNSCLSEFNIDEFKITTGEKLVRAQRFYESLGAKKVTSIEVHRGQKTFVYIYKNVNKETSRVDD